MTTIGAQSQIWRHIQCWTQKRSHKKPSVGFRLALCTLMLDELELAYSKVIKSAREIFQKWWQIQWLCLGDHPCPIDWHHELWPWMTLSHPRSRSGIFKSIYKILSIRKTYCAQKTVTWHISGTQLFAIAIDEISDHIHMGHTRNVLVTHRWVQDIQINHYVKYWFISNKTNLLLSYTYGLFK